MDVKGREAGSNDERAPEDEEFQKDDTEQEYRYDNDPFEVEQSSDSEELCEEREWEAEEKFCRL